MDVTNGGAAAMPDTDQWFWTAPPPLPAKPPRPPVIPRRTSSDFPDNASWQAHRQLRRAQLKAENERSRPPRVRVRDQSKRGRPSRERAQEARREQREQLVESRRHLASPAAFAISSATAVAVTTPTASSASAAVPDVPPAPSPCRTAGPTTAASAYSAASDAPSLAPQQPSIATTAASAGLTDGMDRGEVKVKLSTLLTAMIDARTATGAPKDKMEATSLRDLRRMYRKRELDFDQVRHRLRRLVGRKKLKSELKQHTLTQTTALATAQAPLTSVATSVPLPAPSLVSSSAVTTSGPTTCAFSPCGPRIHFLTASRVRSLAARIRMHKPILLQSFTPLTQPCIQACQ